MSFKAGDQVRVLEGDYKGRTGEVTEVMDGGLYDVEIDGTVWPFFEEEIDEV